MSTQAHSGSVLAPSFRDAARRCAHALVVPAAMLGVALAGAPKLAALPASLAILKVQLPWLVLALGAAIAVAFNRGRAVFALAALAVAHAAWSLGWVGAMRTFPQKTVFAAMVMLLPAYLAVLAWLEERGIWNRHGGDRALLLAALVLLPGWLVVELKRGVTAWIYAPLWTPALHGTPMPQLALVVLGIAVAATVTAALVRRSPVDAGLAMASVAFALACHRIAVPGHFAALITGAAAIVTAAVLEDTYRMAFRDELTGLPSRRAFNEALASLHGRYVLAMVDVDHFKRCNDTYGHDVGDQVLRMVAAKLARVPGGRAYRYGGEEFAIVFRGQRLDEAVQTLEGLRITIAGYSMALRAVDRPSSSRTGRRRRGSARHGDHLSVTVSVGAAESTERVAEPDSVLRLADRALYRAKHRGRNQVAR
jgi:diguanylate cyclase (GGDEF)-like protein